MKLFIFGAIAGAALCILLIYLIKHLRKNNNVKEKFENWILQKRDLKVVAIGGGTGLSTLLRGLKLYTRNITAVVTVADDGGSSGMLREDLGILPPGDIRNCILALADVEPIMERLLQYRFNEGTLKGQNLGNLLIAAVTDIANGFEAGIREISNVLAVTGRVLPVSLEDIHLVAKLEDGTIIHGESKIPDEQIKKKSPIVEISMDKPYCKALPEVIQAIKDADVIVFGPGSLYTSIIPNIIIKEVAQAIGESDAVKVYVCNIMTQPGETTGYSVADHVKAIIKHGGPNLIDLVLVNSTRLPYGLLAKYRLEGSSQVEHTGMEAQKELDIEFIKADLADFSKGLIRHDPQKLAKKIIEIAWDRINSKGLLG
ncbi:MAG: YvcK family protein [Clostridiales bacterium]|nr:YvcK family protein [Clostridiales bacterium]